MFSKKFVVDAFERAISTLAQAYIAAAVVTGGIFDLQALKIAAGAGVLSLVKAVAATKVGDPSSAGLTVGPVSVDLPSN